MKRDRIYLRDPKSGGEAQRRIGTWMTYYNHDRPHAHLGDDKAAMEAHNQKQAA